MSFSQTVLDELVRDDNLSQELDHDRAFVRQCFIYGGNVSNPGKTYHMEFALSKEEAEKLAKIFVKFQLNPKKLVRGGQNVVYIKESEGIADVLNIMGAHKSLLELENMRVEKDVRNTINRKVNFETANLNKTVGAALDQINAIKYIAQEVGLTQLSKPLKEIAKLRLENEALSLTEIGELANPPIGKSGVNHRLRKICKIARELEKNKLNQNKK